MKYYILLTIIFSISSMILNGERVNSLIDSWSIIVLIEKDVEVENALKITFIKNEGEFAINQEQIEQFKMQFSNDIAQLQDGALFWAASYNKGKKTTRTKKITSELARDLRRLFRGLSITAVQVRGQ